MESNLSPVEHQLMLQLDLEDVLAKTDSTDQTKKNLVINYLKNIQKSPIEIEDVFKDLDWVNVSRPLSLKTDLKGLITLCDFFTYCCINCLHILPFLNKIEQKYASKEVVVLGIHSPKFENEKSIQNVANAIMRHDIVHPVCNDPRLKLWKQLSISCWPTIAITSPHGELLFLLIGENVIQNKLEFYTEICLEYFAQVLDLEKKRSIPIHLFRDHQKKTDLNYPTKISVSGDEKRISIANTLNHSIIVLSTAGNVEFTIGSGAGFQDGPIEQALFNYPQGMAWIGPDTFYVCDTGNGAIRKVDLINQTVETVAGHQPDATLNSPWDLVYNPVDERLYCAMAGVHQIWTLVLSEQGDTIHDEFHPKGSFLCFAGDGNEQKRNHRSLLKSSFAQPSGLAIESDSIFVADSESSSIRKIDLTNHSVSTLIGGSPDPSDLFAFGDNDGVGSKCRLQHCMGISSSPDHESLYLCDTFNHKIKKVELQTKKCKTLNIVWTDVDGQKCFNEPNGLCCIKHQNTLLVADTNNHRIISINLKDLKASNFYLLDSNVSTSIVEETDSTSKVNDDDDDDEDFVLVQDELILSTNQELSLVLNFKFTKELKADAEARHKINCIVGDQKLLMVEPESLVVENLDQDIEFIVRCAPLNIGENQTPKTQLSIVCDLNLCHRQEKYCTFKRYKLTQPIRIDVQNKMTNVGGRMRKVIEIHS